MKTTTLLLLFVTAVNGMAQQQNFKNPSKHGSALPVSPHHQKTQRATSAAGLKDSTHLYLLEFVSGIYTLDRTIYSYDINNNENHLITYRQEPTNWQQIFQSINYSYNSNNDLLSVTHQFWDIPSSSWVNSLKVDATFNSTNDKTSGITQRWNGSSWINDNQGFSTYDSNHNCLTVHTQTFNVVASQWENERFYTYAYDANNNMTLDLTQEWDASTSSWANKTKNSATFNSSNEYLTYIGQNWNNTTMQWENSARLLNTTYTNGDLVYYEVENWNVSTLQYTLSFRVTMNYDFNHNELGFMSQTFNTTTNQWENTDKDDYTYDSNNNQTIGLFYVGDQNTNGWKNFQRQFDYYDYSVGIKELNSKEYVVQLYPNPVKDILTIKSDDLLSFTEISLIDVNGRIVLSTSIDESDSVSLDVNAVPSGIYILQLKTKNDMLFKKVIKE